MSAILLSWRMDLGCRRRAFPESLVEKKYFHCTELDHILGITSIRPTTEYQNTHEHVRGATINRVFQNEENNICLRICCIATVKNASLSDRSNQESKGERRLRGR